MGTKHVVDEVLREAELQKSRKKGRTAQAGERPEQEEQPGTIRHEAAGRAQHWRAAARKDRAAGETAVLGDDELAERAEEDVRGADGVDHGFQLEGFNMREERAQGFFGEEGGVAIRESREAKGDQDAWLAAEGGELVSDAVAKRLQEREAEEFLAPEMTSWQAADLKRGLAELLREGETVKAAMKRLRPAQKPRQEPKGRRKKLAEAAAAAAAAAAAKADPADPQPAAKGASTSLADFNSVVERASALLDAGNLDVYDQTREALLQEAAQATKGGDDMFGGSDSEG